MLAATDLLGRPSDRLSPALPSPTELRPQMRIALVAACALPIWSAGGQMRDTLVVYHDSRVARFRRDTVRTGDVIRLGRPYKLLVRVEHTNSALFDCSFKSEPVSLPELSATVGFMKVLGAYVPDLATNARRSVLGGLGIRGLGVGVDTSGLPDRAALRDALERVTVALSDPKTGIHTVHARTLAELQRMQALPPGADLGLSSYDRDAGEFCSVASSRCLSLVQRPKLVDALAELSTLYLPFARAVEAYAAKPRTTEQERFVDGLRKMADAAEALVSNSGQLVAYSLEVEAMARRT
jgi:hypothetical protein